MADVHWSARATRSVLEIERYLNERNPAAALAVVAEIERTCALVAGMPMMAPRVGTLNLRMHITRRYRYRLVYRVVEGGIEVREVLHPRRAF